MARPRIEIDWDTFEKLCALHCTLAEIAGILKVSDDTIERAVKRKYKRGFAEVYRQKASSGKMSIRRKQYEIAMSGNVTMLIWLGKQWLHQTDKQEIVERSEYKYTPPDSLKDDEAPETKGSPKGQDAV